jgi:hypothetical protein
MLDKVLLLLVPSSAEGFCMSEVRALESCLGTWYTCEFCGIILIRTKYVSLKHKTHLGSCIRNMLEFKGTVIWIAPSTS